MVSEVLYNWGPTIRMETQSIPRKSHQVHFTDIILYYIMTARLSCFKSVLIRAIELRIAIFQQVASPYLIHNWCQCIRVYIHIRIHSFQEYTQTRENKDYLRIRLHLRNYNNVIQIIKDKHVFNPTSMSTFIYLFTQTTHIICACTRYVNCVRVTFALPYIFSNVIPQVRSLFSDTLLKRFGRQLLLYLKIFLPIMCAY